MRRHRKLLALLLLATCASATAADYTLADGSVHFSTPDGWRRIMQTQGDPEMMAFQVPDPSPTAQSTLARVTVSSTHVADIAGFQHYVATAMAKARTLPGYHPDQAKSGPTWSTYAAQESGEAQAYVERYYFHNGVAVQLRCVRPAASQAGAAWSAAFDKGCDSIASDL
jgi:hypothetical protein